MKRPRTALCMLMILLATSLYAVGFAADRDNASSLSGAADWAADDSDWCEYANRSYCEYAYGRPAGDDSYDACTAGDDDSGSLCNDDCTSVSDSSDESESIVYDENDELDMSQYETADFEAETLDDSASFDYDSQFISEDCDELAEYPEPQSPAAGSWCGRYCVAPEAEAPVADCLPAGAIRDLVDRLSDSLIGMLDSRGLGGGVGSGSVTLPLSGRLGLMSGDDWSAANGALAAGMDQSVAVGPLPLRAQNLQLLVGEPKPITVRDLVRPLARMAVHLHDRWQATWSEMNEIAAEPDPVPAVSSRPQPPQAAEPSSDPGRDTRTSLRRNPRRVEI